MGTHTGRRPAAGKRSSRNRSRHARRLIEALDPRVLLDGTITAQLSPTIAQTVLATPLGLSSPRASWLAPAAVQSFYGFNNISFLNAAVSGDGTGQTIAIVDWGHDPNIASDLDAFDSHWSVTGGDASSFLTVYAQSGADGNFYLASDISAPNLPADASAVGSDAEISMDVEWAHAIAPGAQIALVEAQYSDTHLTDNVSAAIDFAKVLPDVSVVSMSFGQADSSPFANTVLSQAGVTFVASSGDWGSYAYPITDPYTGTGPDGSIEGTVSGSGLGSTSDTFTPAILESDSADFTVITYVNADTTAQQAGISIRTGDGSPGGQANVSILARPYSGSGGSFQYRTVANQGTTVNNVASAAVGTFLGIRRSGTTYYAYTSPNGYAWTQVGSVAVSAMSGSVTIDLVGAGSSPQNFVDFAYANVAFASGAAAESPASSPNVLAVGGTVLATNGAGTITGETAAWGNGAASYSLGGSGGGYSSISASRPAYQSGISGLASNGERALPDVSLDGGTPVAVYDSDNASPGWIGEWGTSFGAPAWAGLIAIADQGRAYVALPPLTSSQDVSQDLPTVQQLLYSLPFTTTAATSDFNDIKSGNNGGYTAGSSGGFDLVTGSGRRTPTRWSRTSHRW